MVWSEIFLLIHYPKDGGLFIKKGIQKTIFMHFIKHFFQLFYGPNYWPIYFFYTAIFGLISTGLSLTYYMYFCPFPFSFTFFLLILNLIWGILALLLLPCFSLPLRLAFCPRHPRMGGGTHFGCSEKLLSRTVASGDGTASSSRDFPRNCPVFTCFHSSCHWQQLFPQSAPIFCPKLNVLFLETRNYY